MSGFGACDSTVELLLLIFYCLEHGKNKKSVAFVRFAARDDICDRFQKQFTENALMGAKTAACAASQRLTKLVRHST
jgi:hypothetical protein